MFVTNKNVSSSKEEISLLDSSIILCTRSNLHSSTKQIVSEFLQCARHCGRHQGQNLQQDPHSPAHTGLQPGEKAPSWVQPWHVLTHHRHYLAATAAGQIWLWFRERGKRQPEEPDAQAEFKGWVRTRQAENEGRNFQTGAPLVPGKHRVHWCMWHSHRSAH